MAVSCLKTAQDCGACSDANTNRGFLLEAATTRTAKQSPGVPASSSASLHKPRLRHQPHKSTPVVTPSPVLTPPPCRLCTAGRSPAHWSNWMPTSKRPPEFSLFSTAGSSKDPDQASCCWEPQPGVLTSTQPRCNSAHRVSSPTGRTSQSLWHQTFSN